MANDTPGSDVPSDGRGPQAGHPPTSPYARPDPVEDGEQTARPGVDDDAAASSGDGTGDTGRRAAGVDEGGPGGGQDVAAQDAAGQDAGGRDAAAQAVAGQDTGAGASWPSGSHTTDPHTTDPHGVGPYGPDWYGPEAARSASDRSSTDQLGTGQPGAQYPGAQYPGAQYPAAQYGGGAYGGSQYGGSQYGGTQYGGTQYGPPPYAPYAAPGPYAASAYGTPQGGTRAARPPGFAVGRGALVAIALVTALLGGAIGGAVGSTLARGGGSSGVLGAPLPGVEDASAPLGPVEAVAQRVLPSVVRLLVTGPGAAGEGSGMLLSPDGLMLTNNHVVGPAANGGTITAVFQDGTTAPADIVGLDPSSDLAVIRAQGVTGRTPIEFGNSDAVRVGQQVVAFGSPLGLGGSVTSGIVSAVDRAVSVGAESGASESTVLSALQTDAAINPGNSGGPLTDMQGRVVGINSVIATTGAEGGSIGVGFSIPINQAARTAKELETTGRATRAVLGAGVTSGDPTELTGAVLGSIVPGGPAEKAGIRQGQVVTRVGDRIVTKGDELVAAIRENAPGDVVTLMVDGKPVEVTLGVAGG